MIPDINLIPKLEKNQSDSKILYILVGVITLLLLTFFIWQYFGARADIVKLQSEESSLITQRDEINGQLTTLQSGSQGSLEQSVQFVELVSYPVTPLINETQNLQPTNSYLRDYVFDAEGVTITLDFETLSDISNYVSRLSNSNYINDVQVLSIENFELGTNADTMINFDVVPRYSVEMLLLINTITLATGGGEQ